MDEGNYIINCSKSASRSRKLLLRISLSVLVLSEYCFSSCISIREYVFLCDQLQTTDCNTVNGTNVSMNFVHISAMHEGERAIIAVGFDITCNMPDSFNFKIGDIVIYNKSDSFTSTLPNPLSTSQIYKNDTDTIVVPPRVSKLPSGGYFYSKNNYTRSQFRKLFRRDTMRLYINVPNVVDTVMLLKKM